MSHFTSCMDFFHRYELKGNRSDYSYSRSIDHKVCMTSQRLTVFSSDTNYKQHNPMVCMSARTDKSFMKQIKTDLKRANESILCHCSIAPLTFLKSPHSWVHSVFDFSFFHTYPTAGKNLPQVSQQLLKQE